MFLEASVFKHDFYLLFYREASGQIGKWDASAGVLGMQSMAGIIDIQYLGRGAIVLSVTAVHHHQVCSVNNLRVRHRYCHVDASDDAFSCFP